MDDTEHDFHWPKVKHEVKNKNIEWWDSKMKLIEDKSSILSIVDPSYSHEVKLKRKQKKVLRQSHLNLHKDTSKGSPSFITSVYKTFGADLRQFIKKPMDEVRIWRKVPKIDSISPINKYKMMEEQIRYYFLHMYNENIPNQSECIENVFDSMFSTELHPMSKSVKITSKLLPVVPDATVKKFQMSLLTESEKIERMIHKDVAKEIKKNKLRPAFAKRRQNNFTFNSLCKYELKSKSIKFHHTHKELETFSFVWKNILELETTRRFCTWLAAKPHISPPIYLAKEGMLDKLQSISDNPSMFMDLDLDDYDEFDAACELKKVFSRKSLESIDSLDTLSSISSLESFDISDINIIV